MADSPYNQLIDAVTHDIISPSRDTQACRAIVIAVLDDVMQALRIDIHPQGAESHPLPSLTQEQVEQMHRQAVAKALQLHLSQAEAELLAQSLIKQWQSLTIEAFDLKIPIPFPVPSPATAPPPPEPPTPPSPAPVPPHYLQGRMPQQVRLGDRIPLQVRIAVSQDSDGSMSANLASFPVPADIKLVIYSATLLPLSPAIQTVHVPENGDSDWVLFEIEAQKEDVHKLEVSAYNGGAFLGTLSLQVTVDSRVATGASIEHNQIISVRQPTQGEVTLVIHYDDSNHIYRYQLQSTLFGETDDIQSSRLQRPREEAIIDLINQLNAQAESMTGFTAEQVRKWLRGQGTILWNELIPKDLNSLFWQQREKITQMTILSSGDPMPWEILYPTSDNRNDDAGFLVEQFPVVRWHFGPPPVNRLQFTQPTFVLPDGSPQTAESEISQLKSKMSGGQEIHDLTSLLHLFDTPQFGLLHFACHDTFRTDSPTSTYVNFRGQHFEPTFLAGYRQSFSSQCPLVFMNACGSAGEAANYTQLVGWADSFLSAGAGAYVGSLWEVRDSSASTFAEAFYTQILAGSTLGDAMVKARKAIQDIPGDPTWLAYSLYGNPNARVMKEA